MKLIQLWRSLPDSVCCDYGPYQVRGLTYDSRLVEADYAFFAISGTADDGHRHVQDALARGASAVVVERPLDLRPRVPQIIVRNARRALAEAARSYFNDPSKRLTVSAVTGTNGKSSCVWLCRAMLEEAGRRAGLMSTVTVDAGKKRYQASHTTPESLDLHRYLNEMVDAGLEYAVVEASSHALDQGRLQGVQLATGVFTNLTRDHLDYHKNMVKYLDCKARLFEMLPEDGTAILNADDTSSHQIAKRCAAKKLWYGLGAQDVSAKVREISQDGTRLTLQTPKGARDVSSRLLGEHNVYNILAATANSLALGLDLDAVCTAIERFTGVPGRLQRVEAGQRFRVLVDYAHTDDALRNVLRALRPLCDGNRLLLVFGCGGDRDCTKRPLMGAAAEELADQFWITSDNPRTEDPDQIIREIVSGLTREPANDPEPDRRKAIEAALTTAEPGDIVLIAGKGHEDYQILGTERVDFDDSEVALEILRSME